MTHFYPRSHCLLLASRPCAPLLVAVMPSREEVTIEIPMDQGDYLGAEVDVQLVVVRIQPGTLAQDKLQVRLHLSHYHLSLFDLER